MFMACRHIKTNGLRCESPVLKGGRFCYYHSKINSVGGEPHLRFGPLQLPAPEDPAAIQLSVARINDAVINSRLDLRKAAILLNGLRIAARFIDRKQFFDATETVQSAEQAADGSELAPLDYVCDDDEECNDCLYSDLCPRCIHPGDDDKEEDENDEEDKDHEKNDEDEQNE
jgi:hypothetical protein